MSLIFFDGVRDDERTHVSGTVAVWVTADMTCARTLREQLCALLGEPVSEGILPSQPKDVLDALENPWPGAVRLE